MEKQKMSKRTWQKRNARIRANIRKAVRERFLKEHPVKLLFACKIRGSY